MRIRNMRCFWRRPSSARSTNTNLLNSSELYNSRTSEMREEEFEGIIKDALYTALQAESTYYESAASKMYVDKLVASLPKWWVPADQISLLPKRGESEET